MNYITSADVTWVHLKQFPSAVISPYVTEANAWMDDYASQLGVASASISATVSMVIKRYLTNYVAYRFCEDSLCANNVELTENDMYIVSKEKFYIIAEELKKQITPELIMGVSFNNPTSRSVSTGKLFRTA
jgi:hypothetical protein